MPVRIRCPDKPRIRTKARGFKGRSTSFGNRSNGVLWGQETKPPHLRIDLIIVRPQVKMAMFT